MFALFILALYLKDVYKNKMISDLKQDLDQVHYNVLKAAIEDVLQHVRMKLQEEI